MHHLKQFVIACWAMCVMILRKINGDRQVEIVVATPGTAGSLGDQALLQGIWAGFARSEGAQLRQLLLPGFELIPTDPPGLPAKRVTNYSMFGDLKFLWHLRNARLFCVPGADVMDGVYDRHQALAYLHMSDLAVRAGVRARLFGFSFSSRPSREVVERFKSLSPEVVCCVRDPGSLARFERMTGRRGALVADLAFLLEPEKRAAIALDLSRWITAKHQVLAGTQERPIVIAINANALTGLEKQEVIVDVFVALIDKLAARHPNMGFLLIPHDFRSEGSDASVNPVIHARLEASIQSRTRLVTPPFDSWDAKALVGECDLLVTGRMHLAVAALGMGVPVIGIDYNDKFTGLFSYFNIESLVVTAAEAYAAHGLETLVVQTLPRCDDIKRHLTARRDRVRQLSRRNFAEFKVDPIGTPALSSVF
ncbi:MAG: polysaccharide pyruvyl transferase family protein [Betaproteobacteria bacterium]